MPTSARGSRRPIREDADMRPHLAALPPPPASAGAGRVDSGPQARAGWGESDLGPIVGAARTLAPHPRSGFARLDPSFVGRAIDPRLTECALATINYIDNTLRPRRN